MIYSLLLGGTSIDRKRQILSLIKQGRIRLGGNSKLKIYGTLHCYSGKRMREKTRVFFASEQEAISAGYRPCAHCLKDQYRLWKIDQE